MSFGDRLQASSTHTLLVLGLDPNPEGLPACYDTGSLLSRLEAWMLDVIQATKGQVCAYKPTLGFYVALGAAGFDLLRSLMQQLPAGIPVILDAKHSDLNTSTVMAEFWLQQWGMDALTLSGYSGQDLVAPFLLDSDHAVFVLACTSNPAAAALQAYPTTGDPFWVHLVKTCQSWGTAEQVALEVGSAAAEVYATVRELAPERWILARSLWSDPTALPAIVQAGLDTNGNGLLVPIPQDWLGFPPETLTQQVGSLRQTLEEMRQEVRSVAATCPVWTADRCLLAQHPHQDFILQLYDVGCIMFGDYVQASGDSFPYYIDLRRIISQPQVFHQALNAYAAILETLTFDRIAGIPYGSLPTATGLALRLQRPMIFPRKEVKAHGTRRLIEGQFHPGETVVVVDDILISGKSAIEGVGKLESAGLTVKDIVVLIDHEAGVTERIRAAGYTPHAVLRLSEITQTLYEAGRISDEQWQSLQHT